MWWNKQKEQNMNWTCTSTTILPIPTAKEAKAIADKAEKQRLASAEQAIFDSACLAINRMAKKGYCAAEIDPRNAACSIDPDIDDYLIKRAGEACVKHLETYGYSATFVDKYSMRIRWDDPKELNFDELWTIAQEGI